MHLLRVEGGSFVFVLGKQERTLVRDLVRLYPLVPLTHHRLSRTAGPDEQRANQDLLTEAMAGQKHENKRRLEALFARNRRLTLVGQRYHLELERDQIEWLLQVLNDIRVGSWLILGCPDREERKQPEVTADNVRYLLAWELADHLVVTLLEAVDGHA